MSKRRYFEAISLDTSFSIICLKERKKKKVMVTEKQEGHKEMKRDRGGGQVVRLSSLTIGTSL